MLSKVLMSFLLVLSAFNLNAVNNHEQPQNIETMLEAFLNSEWKHMAKYHRGRVQEDVKNRVEKFNETELTLSEYFDKWVSERGNTEELRIPEDISRGFFKTLLSIFSSSKKLVDQRLLNDNI